MQITHEKNIEGESQSPGVDVREVQTQSEDARMIETHDGRPEIPDLNAPVSDDDLGYERIEENSQIMLRRV